MKATGIVRRVDSLGRVVIPKEIRHTLRIKEGSPLEIYTDKEGGVTFRKYSPLGDLQEYSAQICESIRTATGCIAAVADRDTLVALSGGPRREMVDRPCSRELDQLMEHRRPYRYRSGEAPVAASELSPRYLVRLMVPVLCQGDLIGCVMLLQMAEALQEPEPAQELVLNTVADFLGRQMDS